MDLVRGYKEIRSFDEILLIIFRGYNFIILYKKYFESMY